MPEGLCNEKFVHLYLDMNVLSLCHSKFTNLRFLNKVLPNQSCGREVSAFYILKLGKGVDRKRCSTSTSFTQVWVHATMIASDEPWGAGVTEVL